MDDDALPLLLNFVTRDPTVPDDIDLFFATTLGNTGDSGYDNMNFIIIILYYIILYYII